MVKKAKTPQKQKPYQPQSPKNPLFSNYTDIYLKTENHKDYYTSLAQGQDVVGHGVAGSGKTYITLHYALNQLNRGQIQKIIIIRSAVSTRDIGFLPGSEQEKLTAYETPYINTINSILQRGDAYDILKKRNEIEFMSSSYLRGLTFDNTFIIVDEAQNMTWHEIDTIYTRTGENTQVAFIGDLIQKDNGVGREGSGFGKLIEVASSLDSFDVHEFGIDDIVRSEKVKKWIIRTQIFQRYD